MFGFDRKPKPAPANDVEVIQTILGSVMQLSNRTAKALQNAIGEDWLASPAARFELEVYNLFKVDYAACGRLSEPDRTKLMNNCELGIAVRFERPELDADRDHIIKAIASRMDEYGQRAQGKADVGDLILSLINGASNKLITSGPTLTRIEVNPPITITDIINDFQLKILMVKCEKELDGLNFLGFLIKLFKTHPRIFMLTGAQIRDMWTQEVS